MVVCAFVFFLLTIVLSVLLRLMDSDYPMVSPNSSSKSNRTIIERGKMETPNTHIYDWSIYWLGTGSSIKSSGVMLFYGLKS